MYIHSILQIIDEIRFGFKFLMFRQGTYIRKSRSLNSNLINLIDNARELVMLGLGRIIFILLNRYRITATQKPYPDIHPHPDFVIQQAGYRISCSEKVGYPAESNIQSISMDYISIKYNILIIHIRQSSDILYNQRRKLIILCCYRYVVSKSVI